MKNVVVIGAGIGGLTAAAMLAKAGLQVTVLEAQTYPGGCASTFFHQKYLFDAGATLAAGFYPGGPMEKIGEAVEIFDWGYQPADPAMLIHLPSRKQHLRGSNIEPAETLEDRAFWRWQQQTAAHLWALALRSPHWPPQSPAQWMDLARDGMAWVGENPLQRLSAGLIADAFRPAAARMGRVSQDLRQIIDAQLLISAQTTSEHAGALYAASALDLPRRGVVHLKGGMGSIANQLVEAIRQFGGSVLYRQRVRKIRMENGRVVAVEIRSGASIPADAVIANLTPWNVKELIDDENMPARLRNLPLQPRDGWGAFVVYAGIDGQGLAEDGPLHHQVLESSSLGEGRSVFLSISPAWDTGRAPAGMRAVTLSTHTRFGPWWDRYENDRLGYESCKQTYTERVLRVAGRAIPDLRERIEICLPGTPVTFERFTSRKWGWVGGFPQESLFQSWGPRLANGLWMVGDSIFPGQSTAAVALGGVRVAEDVQRTAGAFKTNRAKMAWRASSQ